jgi:uncharacterized membrane protein
MNGQRSIDELAEELLGKQSAALSASERRVLKHIHNRQVMDYNPDEAEANSTFGDRLADRTAAVGGSWGFIIAFGVVLFGWMLLNSEILGRIGHAFDPYPYIFLNLMLSTLAAIQAPIILMSQNRQAHKDRVAASHDFEVNLRAELEIMHLHRKIDTLVEIIADLHDRAKQGDAA